MRKSLCICISIFVLIFFFFDSYAQEFLYDHFTKEQGLGGNTAYCISQDKDGFIWIGTDGGASRFDGYSFENFTVEDGLADNEVLEVFSDSKGRTWFTCFAGAMCYYFNGKIYNASNDRILDSIKDNKMLHEVTEDKEGNIWGIGRNIFAYMNNGKLLKTEAVNPDDSPERRIPTFKIRYYVPSKNKNGITYNLGLKVFDVNLDGKRTFKDIYDGSDVIEVINKEAVTGIGTHDANYTYIYTTKGYSLIYIDRTNKKWKSIYHRKENVNKIIFDKNSGKNWVTTSGSGCYTVSPDSADGQRYLPSGNVSRVMTDLSGNKWFTTLDNGVYLTRKNEFKVFNKNTGLPDNNIRFLAMGIDSSILIDANNVSLMRYKNGGLQRVSTLDQARYENGQIIQAVEMKDKLLIAGTLNAFYLKNGKREQVTSNSVSACKSISMVNANDFYLANHTGIYFFTPHSIDTILFTERFTMLSNYRNGKLWAASVSRFYSCEEKKLTPWPAYSIEKHGRVMDMQINNRNLTAVATYSAGIHYIYKGKLYSTGQVNGLSSNTIRDICFQNDSILWVATDKGISRITINYTDFLKTKLINYFVADDLPYCNIRKMEIAHDTAWLATDKGLVFFEPGKLSKGNSFSIVITGLFHDDVNYIQREKTPEFRSDKGALQIAFSAILFNGNNELIFKYRLSGKEESWSTTKQRKIEFAALSPGHYQFEVYAINADGVKSINTAKISFEILPLWYQTRWFRLTMLALFVVCLYILIQLRIRNVKRKAEEKSLLAKRLSELKLEAIRSQLNPHFIFNSLNAVQNFLVEHDADSANDYLTDFSVVIRKSLRLSMQNFCFLNEELELLNAYLRLEKMRFEGAFNYEIDVNLPNAGQTIVPTMIFQHYVENAVKYGVRGIKYDSYIKVRFSSAGKNIVCEIEDNGRGINATSQVNHRAESGLGMKLHLNRTELIRKSFNVSVTIEVINKSDVSPDQTGVLVIITIPVITSDQMENLNPSVVPSYE